MKNTIIFLFIFFLTFGLCSCLTPYPFFAQQTNLSSSNSVKINDYKELELEKSSPAKAAAILPLKFDQINYLLPVDCEFEIVEPTTGKSFFAIRVGGKNHLDIQPKNEEESQKFLQIFSQLSTQRKSVLVKLSKTAFVSASLTPYPHGYHVKPCQLSGHMCLHFEGSKTDGTNVEDFAHQQCIKKSKFLAEQYISQKTHKTLSEANTSLQ